MSRQRIAAGLALILGAATLALAVAVAVSEFPRGLGLAACVLVAAAAAWYGVLRRGVARVAGLAVAVLALAAAVALLVDGGTPVPELLVIAGLLAFLAAARASLGEHVDLPSAPAPRQPVLFFNPRSGGGKAERFSLAAEARARGIEPIELKPGDDLEVLVRTAVERGADGLAMAGGDGSQAIVAAIAAERGLAVLVRAGRDAQPLRARPRRRPRRRGGRPRFVRGRRRANRGPGRGQRTRVRQQRLARGLCRGRAARGLSRREAAHAARHRAGCDGA